MTDLDKNSRWPELMTKELAAEYLGISTRSIERLLGEQILCWVQARERLFRLRKTDLDAFVQSLPYAEAPQIGSRQTNLPTSE